MFYDINQVDNAMLCQHCEGRLEEPKILPCGETICSFCEASMQINDGIFDCLVCKEKHEMPKNGLPNNKAILKMLSIKPTKVSRGKAFDKFQESLNDIRISINLIKNGIKRDDYVKEHCIELRNNVQLVTEKAIQQINDFNTEIIKKIDVYEKEQLQMSQYIANISLNSSFKDLNDFLKDMQSFYGENIKYLNENQTKDSVFEKLSSAAFSMNRLAKDKIKNLQRINLGGRVMKFETKFYDPISLGETTVIDTRIISTILTEKKQIEDLINLNEFPLFQTWTLIYRASQDGFEASSFHAKCDNKPNTLIIIKAINGNVFGGYTEQSWSGQSCFKVDSNAFLFSLVNNLKKPIKLKCIFPENAIVCNPSYGPIFGSGHDLLIADKSNLKNINTSSLGHSYSYPEYRFGYDIDKFLAGTSRFQSSEIEVYSK